MRVLLIEDHPIVSAGCRRLLQTRAEIEMFEAGTGSEGLRLCRELGPDVVILDLKLPDSNGFTVLRAGGVEYVIVNFGGSIKNIRRFAKEIMPHFAGEPRLADAAK